MPNTDDTLPGARAAVLARLWGALVREPLPGVAERRVYGTDVLVTLASGQRLMGSAAMAEMFAVAPEGLRIALETERHDDPAALLRALDLPGHPRRLAEEVADSVVQLALARAGQPGPHRGTPVLDALAGRADGLAVLEQAVVDGHPLHPCCRTRLGMSQAESLAYAPEHRPTVGLEVFTVPARRWLTTGAGLAPRLPVHPWQREHVLSAYPFLKPTGEKIAARPLMSLRTLAAVADPTRHYKTSVDVQMTSAVRIVSPAAVRNGPVVSKLLAQLGADLGLSVWPELAAGAVLDESGQPLRSLAVVARRAARPGPNEVILPVAALSAPSPADGRPLLCEAVTSGYGGHPAGFVADLAGLIVPVLLTLLHRGVALEAHGQNLLVTLSHGRPTGLSYRDIGGIRVSPQRLRRHGADVPALHGDLATDDPAQLRAKVLASGIAVALGEPIATVSREYGVDPAALWRLVRDRVEALYDALPPSAAGDARAVLGDTLPLKATTVMRLADDPLADVWAALPNPLAQ
ncbi:iron transporter [Catellatospora sp. TT07R-123]|uniref:IucA/IucC family protein n=1 Tax=Catellatospora sp. TT07R-123 TaxID=2733863 RepID=UPI001B213501|nr:IucA/IucC family protein [Catellatospora sp. TT07R-123]GHJ44447.1 iron transporter [Catellatospora sp. TT07R-123]